jgi:hemerythrin-like domain-containing protein
MPDKPGASAFLRGSGGTPDFDHPLEMLAACHDRIEDRCDLLHRMVEHLAESGCDSQARQAATSVLRYFDTAGEHHHEDEERNLFPALLAADPQTAAALVQRLREDHVEMRKSWQALRRTLVELEAGVAATLQVQDVERFTGLYRGHIQCEEAQLLPLAQRVLGPEVLAAIGVAMAQRRGVAK